MFYILVCIPGGKKNREGEAVEADLRHLGQVMNTTATYP
jgi:hypothetical protein